MIQGVGNDTLGRQRHKGSVNDCDYEHEHEHDDAGFVPTTHIPLNSVTAVAP